MTLLLIVTNITLQVSSFILVKLAATNASGYIELFFNVFYLFAILLVLIRSVVWQLILKEKELSEVYPINSVVPVFILLSSVMVFNESISFNNIIGVMVLMIGIFLIVTNK